MFCNHLNCYLQNHTTYQFTYFIYYLFQDKFKNSRIIKIQQVHQSYQENIIEFWDYLFLFIFHLNLKFKSDFQVNRD